MLKFSHYIYLNFFFLETNKNELKKYLNQETFPKKEKTTTVHYGQ